MSTKQKGRRNAEPEATVEETNVEETVAPVEATAPEAVVPVEATIEEAPVAPVAPVEETAPAPEPAPEPASEPTPEPAPEQPAVVTAGSAYRVAVEFFYYQNRFWPIGAEVPLSESDAATLLSAGKVTR